MEQMTGQKKKEAGTGRTATRKDPREAKAAKHESRCKGRIRFCQGLVEKHQQLEFECN